jgi:16S rRNA pseudouridine516 synthase
MNAADLLYSQGFGTRRHCIALVEEGFFEINTLHGSDGLQLEIIKDPYTPVENWFTQDKDGPFKPTKGLEVLEGLHYTVEQVRWTYHCVAYVMLNKPIGIECSQKPSNWPSVYTLLPSPLRQRPRKGATPGIQAVGRLDQDTTGLLLLSDDGQFIHKMSSPRHHVPKIYEVTTEDPLEQNVCDQLMKGVQLKDEYELILAKSAQLTGEFTLRLTLTQGKYHQVKRMLAATGHKVTQLHRSQIGTLTIPAELKEGEWRWLSRNDIDALFRA